MFGNLKKKLNSAFQEGLIITESLQQQFQQRINSSSSTTPTTPTLDDCIVASSSTGCGSTANLYRSSTDLGIPMDLNMAAGCNLLAKYEDDWKAIQDANEQNGLKAAKVAEQIESIQQRTNAQRTVMTDLISCLSGIPTLVDKLKASTEALEEVRELSETAEEKLEQLENTCEQCELEEFMLQKEYELSQYKQQKMSELELYRQQLAAEHQEKVRSHEARWQEIQRERQAVFEYAFRDDLAEFKEKGTIPKLECKNSSNKLALEEVVLDDSETKDALEDFLNG